MIRYLIRRPVAVLMSFTALVIIGILVMGNIPMSLLPNIDVPKLIVRVDYPNTPAVIVEDNVLGQIREALAHTDHLKTIESRAANHTGQIQLTFDYGTRMNLAYIEANEKLDKVTPLLPANISRPQVIRVTTSDIPLVRIQVQPKQGVNLEQASELTEDILKKRLEELDGVSLVDINGRQRSVISIAPKADILTGLGLDAGVISETIRASESYNGSLSLQEGQYQYFVKIENSLESLEKISQLPISTRDGGTVELGMIAKITRDTETATGFHLFNGKEGLVITVHKQAESRMGDVSEAIKKLLTHFKKDYPEIDFKLTQDQSFLLDASIDNLIQDLIIGGALTIGVLFLLLANKATAILMSISIPVSLAITFIFFKIFGISFNIISLSGLALGIGMLIDNAIVVADNIARRHREGEGHESSAIEGTREVIAPVISQVLTTVAVYAPLILLSGIAGALVFDQSVALTISLVVSLAVSFVLIPLLYKVFVYGTGQNKSMDTAMYIWIAGRYHAMIDHILQRRSRYFFITLTLMPVGFCLAFFMPVSDLPEMDKKESLAMIDWNEPVSATENLNRVKKLVSIIKPLCLFTESEVGLKQFLLQQDNNGVEKCELYFSCHAEKDKFQSDKILQKWVKQHYPEAGVRIIDAPNAFTQLFNSSTPYFEARFKPLGSDDSNHNWEKFSAAIDGLSSLDFTKGEGFLTEQNIEMVIDHSKLALYNIDFQQLSLSLEQLFGSYTISETSHFGHVNKILLKINDSSLEQKIGNLVRSKNGELYPISSFLTLKYGQQNKYITCDRTGPYRSIFFDKNAADNILKARKAITDLAIRNGYNVSFTGRYFESQSQIKVMWWIFLIVLVLMYFILAFQYESLIQPFVVMLTIPLGITGSMVILWLTNGSLNIMSAVGFIVILGLVVDDPILKVETLNRLVIKYQKQGYQLDESLLHKIIHEAGSICLKPLLMVSLTTSIAMVPVLFIGGIGNELQKPLAVVIIGGLTVGTFFTTWFVPLGYWYLTTLRKRKPVEQHQINIITDI